MKLIFKNINNGKKKVSKAKYIFETSGIRDEDRDTLKAIAEEKPDSCWSTIGEFGGERFTHLITGDSKRTLKAIFAIAFGAQILKPEWIFSCLEKGEWVNENEFIKKDFEKQIQISRESQKKKEVKKRKNEEKKKNEEEKEEKKVEEKKNLYFMVKHLILLELQIHLMISFKI